MHIEPLAIPEVKVVHLDAHADGRGLFVETYTRATFRTFGINLEFIHDSVSVSVKKGTVRGIHFQAPPVAQPKLMRVSRGRAFAVVVDVRRKSPTFGRHVSLVLEEGEWRQLFIPVGFANGFCTLADDTRIDYKMADQYSPQHAMGILWNDPDLGIVWPVTAADAILSDRDRRNPPLQALPPVFA